jgi:hypothetical protein
LIVPKAAGTPRRGLRGRSLQSDSALLFLHLKIVVVDERKVFLGLYDEATLHFAHQLGSRKQNVCCAAGQATENDGLPHG